MKHIARFWYLGFIASLILIGLGAMMLFRPNFSLAELLQYLGYVLIGMGIFTSLIDFWIVKRTGKAEWIWVLTGLAELVAGIAILFNNDSTEWAFLKVIGAFSALMGLILVIRGFLPKTKSQLVMISGVVSCVFGGLILFDVLAPEQSRFVVGLYALLFGLYIANISFKLRSKRNTDRIELTDNQGSETEPMA